jgi:signal transduction histidine kinase
LRAQDEKRRHIARELHDSAGQTLTVLGMSVSHLVQQAGPQDNAWAAEVAAIPDLVQQLHREIRTASYLLHPPMLDENGLAPALRRYVQGLSERSGLEIKPDIAQDFDGHPETLSWSSFAWCNNVSPTFIGTRGAVPLQFESYVMTIPSRWRCGMRVEG